MPLLAGSAVRGPAAPRAWVDGFIGVLIFSASLPATRVALAGFEPLFLTAARAAIAGLVAGAALVVLRECRPGRRDLTSLAIVSLGVVLGFPLLTALALRDVTAAHAIVFIGLLPLATAVSGAIRTGERPSGAFWVFAALGSAVTVIYAAQGVGSVSALGDGLMLGAVLVCGIGYAEGALLARRLGGWQVIAWANVLSLPLTLPLMLLWLPPAPLSAPVPPLLGLGYVSLFSMLIGFVFWYRGLALGGIAAISQLQLLQPFLGLALAAALLHERIDPMMVIAAIAVLVCVAGARRSA